MLKFLSEFNTDPWIIHCHVKVMRNPQGFLDKTSKSRYGLFGKSRNPSWLISWKDNSKMLNSQKYEIDECIFVENMLTRHNHK